MFNINIKGGLTFLLYCKKKKKEKTMKHESVASVININNLQANLFKKR